MGLVYADTEQTRELRARIKRLNILIRRLRDGTQSPKEYLDLALEQAEHWRNYDKGWGLKSTKEDIARYKAVALAWEKEADAWRDCIEYGDLEVPDGAQT